MKNHEHNQIWVERFGKFIKTRCVVCGQLGLLVLTEFNETVAAKVDKFIGKNSNR